MAGKGRQAKVKRDQRAADMSGPIDRPQTWVPPHPDEHAEPTTFEFTPEGANPTEDRIKVRMVMHIERDHQLLDFAVVHQTFYRQRWRDVAKADSSHDDEVHIHRYSRRTGEQVGNTEQVCPVTCQTDIETGYDTAYDRIVADWRTNKRRWHDV